ncbi:MAG: CPBP family intramembrane metalloprotease [Syntrophorhabdaceae bacterium]|nr:CPBP family intramembrane metalloprotease [Syntrophorhabdaceae bacterium]
MSKSFEIIEQRGTTGLYILVLVLLIGPFYLNDFANIFIKDWRLWLFVDYVCVKLAPVVITLSLIRSKKMLPAEFGLTTQSLPSFLLVFLIAALVGTVIDQNGYQLITTLPGYSSLGGMPVIRSNVWNWIDLTLGLLLVGIVEELVFRGYMYTFLSRFTESSSAIVAISSVAFGLAHWSLGLHAVLITSIIGAVFMIVYLKTRALPPIMLAHFVINFIDFSGVVTKSIFKFV